MIPLDLARSLSASYRAGEPYPHAVLDGFFPPESLRAVAEEFPAPSGSWRRFSNRFEKKLALGDKGSWGPRTRGLMEELNSRPFLEFLETLTGIPRLLPDPFFLGGGLHQILPGGYLKIHADFNRHSRTGWDRRLNLLIYLNEDWEESYGGHFEMWDRGMERCVRRVLPVFNRMVIFSTDDFSYHGHPDPLTCPPGRARRSLALYYYTEGRPASEVRKGAENHTTLYRSRPGEALRPPRLLNAYSRLRSLIFR